MRSRLLALFASAFVLIGLAGLPSAQAEPKAPPALIGKVSSAEEGAMEGVVVSAKKGIVTVSVVSDDKGQFSFPASKLDAGDYALSIRAADYDLDRPKSVTVAADKPAEVDIKLVKTKNLAAQLTNLEWMLSAPGNDDQKRALTGCTNCHSVERILNSTYTADQLVETMKRMATYSNNSFFKKPQIRQAARELDRFVPNADKVAAYFASINRSTGERKWDLKTMPRVTGAGTHVVITEYDLPDPTIQPHDVMVDADGVVWHSDFSGQILGRFDPKTLAYKSFAVPMQREGWPTGALDLEVDPKGDLWLGLMFQAGAAKFDRKTEKFEMLQLPAPLLKADSQQAMVGVQNWTVDNKVWLQDPSVPGIYRMNMTTGQTELYKTYDTMKGVAPYSIFSDKENNIWFLDFGVENIGKIDAKTGAVTLYPTPTKHSRPRRGRIDDQGRIWFGEFAGERIGMFDTKTEKFQEWEVPGRFFAPYDAMADRNGQVWTAGMNADRVLRMDIKTGQFVEYPLPRYTNVRRVFVDNNTTPPTFWVGNNHGAALIKLEPQE
ncbi:MAG TPA: carboxypeptidase regulatory-like domain-containing protein [Xanthobacteraceae bacterium]|jgi:streptogramin lyase